MRKRLLTLLLLPIFAFTTYEWIDVKLDDRVTFTFPGAPTHTEMNGNQLWTYRTTDNSTYLGMTVDFTKLGLDSATLVQQFTMQEFFDQYRDGILGQLPEGKLISESNSKFNGYPVTVYKFSMNTNNTLITYYSKNYFIGTKVYSQSYIVVGDKMKNLDSDRFFGSIKLK